MRPDCRLLTYSLLLPLLLTFSILSMTTDVRADDTEETADSATPAVQRIAFINLRVVLENYKPFQESLEKLREEVQERDAQVKERQAAIQKQVQVAQALTGQAQASLLEDIARAQNDLKIMVQSMKRQLTMKESDIYAEAYKSVQSAVTTYARANGFVAVFNLKEEAMEKDMSNPQSVLQRINREIFWIEPAIDITEEVLEQLNEDKEGEAEETEE